MKICVFEYGFENPASHVSKSRAKAYVRSGEYAWYGKSAIRACHGMIHNPLQPIRRAYIPKKLPPAEVGGCHFQAPIMQPTGVPHLVRLRVAR